MYEYSTAMFLDYMTSETLLSKFSTSLHRWQVERIASGQDKFWSKYTESEYEGDGSVQSMREWLNSLDRSKDFHVGADYDGSISATHEVRVLYTEEQVEVAKAWLRDHPKPEVEHVTWRRHVPFNVEFKESYDN